MVITDDKNPTQSTVKDYASALGLNYEQVRRWYIERRRRDRQNVGQIRGGNGSARCVTKSKNKTKKDQRLSVVEVTEDRNTNMRPGIVQDKLYPPDYIFKKIFRKDGPPLGTEFDSLPTSAFQGRNAVTDIICSNATDQDEQRAPKRRKVSKASEKQSQTKAPVKHGKGKGLMSVWQLTSNASIPEKARASKENKGLSCKNNSQAKRHGMGKGLMIVREQTDIGSVNIRKKKSSTRKPAAVDSSCNKKQKAHREICKLALDTGSYEVSLSSSPELVDDEELELRNFEAGPSALTCSSHFNTGGGHGCSLCKGLLPKFPPDFVKMKKPLSVHPWGSPPKLEKNFFKANALQLNVPFFNAAVFHFLYTYAATLNLCPFTFDEFAKAFIWKESLLLGKVHLCLLLHLLSDVDVQLSSDISIHSNKNGMFLNLLHTVGNSSEHFFLRGCYTWIVLCSSVVQMGVLKGNQGKGAEHMVKYGLRPGTLKAALFDILFERGNKGMKVTELATSSQVVDLNLGKLDDELEDSICSILAGDITLFEKISLSTYRLRLSSVLQKDEDGQSDAEGCGSICDDYRDDNVMGVNYSECDSGNSTSRLSSALHIDEENALIVCSEIDESHPGESWMLGLLEGEYCDLNIEEKLDALLALIDLLSAGSSFRMKGLLGFEVIVLGMMDGKIKEHTRQWKLVVRGGLVVVDSGSLEGDGERDPSTMLTESVPNIYLHGSGGKIKRSTLKQPSSPTSSWADVRETLGARNGYHSLEVCPVDSSVAFSMSCGKEKSLDKEIGSMGTVVEAYLHPMQSIYLGSDRRYNRYWLFLGPCDADDPGHTRIYVQSSEDGLWQVIESEQALCGIVGTLNNQGRREAVLLKSLEKRMPILLREMSFKVMIEAEISHSAHSDISGIDVVNEDSPSPVSGIDNNLSLSEASPLAVISPDTTIVVNKVEVQRQTYTSLQAYDLWIWNCFYSVLHAVKCGKQSYSDSLTRCASCHDLYWRDERHCKTCHTTFELDIDLEEKYDIHVAMCRGSEDTDICPMHKVLPSQLQALKAAAHAIELVMPEDALVGAWQKSAHKLWVRRLRRTSSLHELLQVLSDFVAAINVDWLSQCNAELYCDSFDEDIVSCFQNMPQTLSALALWLVKLDSVIAPHLNEVVEV
ncbi:hypothetical protein KSS87_015764 [Heliosperma pusillum]|nr:hypothetical protein KSS87_015764 [Heliosperma pusillum]